MQLDKYCYICEGMSGIMLHGGTKLPSSATCQPIQLDHILSVTVVEIFTYSCQ